MWETTMEKVPFIYDYEISLFRWKYFLVYNLLRVSKGAEHHWKLSNKSIVIQI